MHDSATLIIRDADGQVQRMPFAAERMIVGRTVDAAVRIDSALVSRQHAELWRDASGRFHVRDLNSRNGTFVNGQPVNDRALESGDFLFIDSTHVLKTGSDVHFELFEVLPVLKSWD